MRILLQLLIVGSSKLLLCKFINSFLKCILVKFNYIGNSLIIYYQHNQPFRKIVLFKLKIYNPIGNETPNYSSLSGVHFNNADAEMTRLCCFEKKKIGLYEIYSIKRTCPNTYCMLLYILKRKMSGIIAFNLK